MDEQQAFSAEELANERWLPVPEWPGYEVSDLGRVRSYRSRKVQRKDRRSPWVIVDTPTLLQPSPRKNGRIALVLMDGKRRKNVQVHQLVLLAFVGPCPEGMEACHAPDPDPTNCRLSNLRWDTHLNNARDRYVDGTYQGITKLTADVIPVIWARLIAGEPRWRIAADYGVSDGTIASIRYRKAWTHITDALPPIPRQRVYTIERLMEVERAYGSLEAAADALGWPLGSLYNRRHFLKRHKAMLANQSA